MSFLWIREHAARWDSNKQRIVGGAAAGIFDSRYKECAEGDPVPGEWWRVEQDGRVVGYGWMDVVWGDAEVLLASDPDKGGAGVGSFIMESLEHEAGVRGLNYIYNMVRPTHPHKDEVSAWLTKRGFFEKEDGRLVRQVGKK